MASADTADLAALIMWILLAVAGLLLAVDLATRAGLAIYRALTGGTRPTPVPRRTPQRKAPSMSVAVLDGGPADGTELRVPDGDPPSTLAIPQKPPWIGPALDQSADPSVIMQPLSIAYYWLRGQDDTGRYHYQWPNTELGNTCTLCFHYAIDHRYGHDYIRCHRCPNGLCEPGTRTARAADPSTTR